MNPEDKKKYTNTKAYESIANLLASLAESADDINALLKSVAQYYAADRAYVFEITPDGKMVDNTYEWCKEGVSAEIDNLQNVPIEACEVWIQEFEKNGAFFISSLDTDVEKSSLTHEILEPQGIDSLITAPLYKDKKISGFIGVDNPRENTHDLLILKTAASIIYSDIRRAIAEKKEKEVAESIQNRFFAGTFLNTFESAYYINLNTNSFVTLRQKEYLHAQYGYQTNWVEVVKKYVDEGVAQEDKDKFAAICDLSLLKEQIEKEAEYHVVFRDISIGHERYCRLYVLRGEDVNHAAVGFVDVDAEIRTEEANAIISSMAEDFDYIAAINQKEKTVTRYWMTDKYKALDEMIDKNLPSYERLDRFFNLTVHPEDMKMFREKSDFNTAIAELDKHPNYKFEVRSLFNGKEEYYRIKFAYKPDDHNVVILGILNIDEQVRREMENAVLQERAELDSQFREQMARVMGLSDNLQAIYDVDIETGKYDVYSYNHEFAEYVLNRNELRTSFYDDTIKDVDLVVYPEDRDLIRNTFGNREYIKEKLMNPSGFSTDYRLMDGDGYTWYRVKLIRKAEDNMRFLVGVFNIDERVRAEKEQQRLLTEQVGRVMELSDDFQAIFDVDLESGEYEIFSYDSAYFDDVLVKMEKGKNFYEDTLKDVEKVVYPEDRDLIRDTFSNREYIRDTLAAQGEFTIDYRLMSNDGPAWYKVRVVKKSGESNRFLVGVFYVDERVRKEAEYKRSIEEEMKVIGGLANDFVSLYSVNLDDNTYKVYSITDTVKDIGTVIDSFSDLSNSLRQYADGYVHEDDKDKIYYYADLDNMRKALEHSRSHKVTVRRNIDGEWKWIEFNMIKCDPIDERANNVILAFSNRDEQVKQDLEIRERLQQAMLTAQEASLAKTNFLFNMSHDIRTPMNAITGFTNMAVKHIDDKDKVLDCLNKTQKAGMMLLSLINNVLEVSRIEAGQALVEEQPGDVFLSFANISSTMQELAETKDIKLRFSFGDIKDRFVYADFSRCMRIFVNIISNAIKYTPEGGYVNVSCEQVERAKDGVATYCYTFTDNGIGMSEEFQQHVFDQFAREKNTTVSGIQGTGLGMSVVKSFVNLLGGKITVKSKQGEGTTFSVLLPFKIQNKDMYTDPVSGEVKSADSNGLSPLYEISFVGKNVLLVEDNELNREIAYEILEEEGMMVESADDGTTAIEIVKEKGADYFDFILMDIQMPVMNGYDATKAIREMYPDAHIPIIALSANAFEEDKRKSLEAGMDDHVAKPIDVLKLKESLAKYL